MPTRISARRSAGGGAGFNGSVVVGVASDVASAGRHERQTTTGRPRVHHARSPITTSAPQSSQVPGRVRRITRGAAGLTAPLASSAQHRRLSPNRHGTDRPQPRRCGDGVQLGAERVTSVHIEVEGEVAAPHK